MPRSAWAQQSSQMKIFSKMWVADLLRRKRSSSKASFSVRTIQIKSFELSFERIRLNLAKLYLITDATDCGALSIENFFWKWNRWHLLNFDLEVISSIWQGQKQAALKKELSFTMCLINLIKRPLPKVAHITLESQSKLKGKEDVNIRAPRR